MALITQAQVERHLQITFGNDPDPVVEEYIAQAQAIADSYCQQPLEEQTDIVETWESDQWEPWYRVKVAPITAVTAITVDGDTLVEGDEYKWYVDGRLRRLLNRNDYSWSRYVDGNAVTYTAGYTSVTAPDDLKLGIVAIAAELFRHGAKFASDGVRGQVTQVQLEGSDSISYAADPADIPAHHDDLITARAKRLLAPFRRRRL